MTIESLFRAAAATTKPAMRAMWLEKAGRLAVTDPERAPAPDFGADLSARGYVGPLDPRRIPPRILPWLMGAAILALFLNALSPHWRA